MGEKKAVGSVLRWLEESLPYVKHFIEVSGWPKQNEAKQEVYKYGFNF